MAQQTRNRPDSQEDQDAEGYDPQSTPGGDPFDPRGDLPPSSQENQGPTSYGPQNAPMGDPSDPRGDLPAGSSMGGASDPASHGGGAQQRPVYDEPGSQYAQDDPADGQVADDPTDDPRNEYDPQKTPMGIKDPLQTPMKDASGPKHRKPKDTKDDEDDEAKQDLREAEDQHGLYNPEEAAEMAQGEISPSDLDEEETSSGLYNSDEDNKKNKKRAFLKRNKKKAGIGGGIFLGLTGGIVGLMAFLLPLKVEHIMNNLEGHFFSSAQTAIREETGNMLKEYMITRVLPGHQSCGGVVQKGCTARRFGQGPVANLYRTWADARLENKLAKIGIHMEYRSLSQTWTLYGPGIPKDGEDIGKDGKGFSKTFDNHPEFKNASVELLERETKSRQVFFRFEINRGMVGGKYGNGRYCVVFCFLTDPLNDKIDTQKKTAKIFLTSRVILPRNESLGVALLCLINSCGPDNNQPSDENVSGAPESDYDKDTRSAIEKYAAAALNRPLTTAAAEKTLGKYNEIAEMGFQKYMITKGLVNVGVSTGTAGTVSDLIPIVGWMNLAAQVVNVSNDSSEGLKKFRYVVNGTVAAVGLYTLYRSQADEVHTGHETATEAGSFAESLSPGNHGEPTDPIVGGTAGAEQMPLYSNLIEGKSITESVASVGGSAGTALCNNGLPLPAGQLICAEEVLGGGNAIANGIHGVINTPPLNALIPIAQAWRATVGQVFDFAGGVMGAAFSAAVALPNALCNVPVAGTVATGGYCAARDAAQKALPAIVEAVTKWLIPNPFSTNMGGGRIFDMLAGGADVLGNEVSHTLLGGQILTPIQRANILGEQRQYEENVFLKKPLFARMFDTNSQYSLASKVAMEVPLGGTEVAAQSGVATLLNPAGALSRGFSSIFAGKVSAANDAEPDPFGVPQYGYPEGTIPKNPEAYWEANCSDDETHAYQKDSNSWNESASGKENSDPDTGTPLNKTTNPCLLIKATVGATGGLWDTNNLSEGARRGLDGSSSNGSESATAISGDAQELAQQILDNSKITKTGRYVMEDLKHTANGQPAYGSVTLNLNLLKFMADLGTTTPYTITSITGAGCGHSDNTCISAGGSSNHYLGKAVDFACGFDEAKADEIGKKYSYMASNERCDNGIDHSHFSKDGY